MVSSTQFSGKILYCRLTDTELSNTENSLWKHTHGFLSMVFLELVVPSFQHS